jgi:hypothetical protein
MDEAFCARTRSRAVITKTRLQAGDIRVFDEVTARAAWQAAALREGPAIAQLRTE